MNAGGIGRHVAGRWGIARAVAINESSSTQTALMIVTPPGSDGLQYAKELTVPAECTLETSWPVRVGQTNVATGEFAYLVFPNGKEDGLIHRGTHDEFIPTYGGLIELDRTTLLTGVLSDRDDPSEHQDSTLSLLRTFLSSGMQQQKVLSINVEGLSLHSECLDPLDHLTLTSSRIFDFPDATESIRAWVQRGGSLWIRLDRTGLESARAILGDALPLTVVGETTTNTVTLKLNPEYRQSLFPTREVERTFDEPIRYVRVVQDGGDAMWSIDGWPVAIRVPVGRGTVVLTTVDASAFFVPQKRQHENDSEFKLIPSAGILHQTLFKYRQESLLHKDDVTEQAASIIGYSIPSKSTAVFLTLCFPVLLLAIGIWLQRREKGERLIFLMPTLAAVVALPAIGIGTLGRRVAPNTVIETALVHSVPGWKHLVTDGYVSIFDVGTDSLKISGTKGAIVQLDSETTNRDYRQLIWHDAETAHWKNLDQPDGIQTFHERSIETLDRPLSVTATFNEAGVVGEFDSGGLKDVADLLIAGNSPNRMSLKLDRDGRFYGTPKDVLPPGIFTSDAIVTDQQRRRAEIYTSVFDPNRSERAFPDVSSLMFWAESNHAMLEIGDVDARHERSLLLVQPLRMISPGIGARITIPSPFIGVRTTANTDGNGFSAIYDNARKQWSKTETSSLSFLEFQVPPVCLPFEVESAELVLTIRAGSRTLTLAAGDFTSQTNFSEMQSPLGEHTIKIPADLIRESCRSGKFYMSLSVSELEGTTKDNQDSTTQDDYWQISQLGITLKGARTAESQ